MKKIQVGGHRGSKIYGYTLVDDVDFYRFNKFKWSNDGHGYVHRRAKNGDKYINICLARQILGAPFGISVDHINRNTLDNRRENLRLATNSQNQMNVGKHSNNSSGFKGVSFYKKYKKFVARIRIENKHIHLGYFDDIKTAAKVYNNAALKYHKEYARLNTIQ